MLFSEEGFEEKYGTVAWHLSESILWEFELLGIVHYVDQLEVLSLVEVMALLVLEDEGVARSDGKFIAFEPVHRVSFGDEGEFAEVMGVLNFSEIVLVGHFSRTRGYAANGDRILGVVEVV